MEIVNIYYSIIIQYASKNREGGGDHLFFIISKLQVNPAHFLHSYI